LAQRIRHMNALIRHWMKSVNCAGIGVIAWRVIGLRFPQPPAYACGNQHGNTD
jgi:hypothetical protein